MAIDTVMPWIVGDPVPATVLELSAAEVRWIRVKWPAIEAYAAGRPLVWIDDEPSTQDAGRVQSRNLHIPTRIVKTDPGSGLLSKHVLLIERFYARLTER